MNAPVPKGLPPVVDDGARLLILGSFPSVQSLVAHQYYANPRNCFWRITSELFGFDQSAPYETRVDALQSHAVALWDVLHKCRRVGSSDSNIDLKSLVPNDFQKLFTCYPSITRVYFNGNKADALFRRFVRVDTTVSYQRLPSTSPAHVMPVCDKLAAWRVISRS
ncbi:DNA-deoxyinosine glycosylase [Mycobacterium botniense]|uniref:DNA-deoxyinosine glycosylase n=1 Tax=Mycobacterium botniense TaxID=84962 RepID=A0A7I9XZ48_9MYCO|nr:DNA-deoxyinosine glycosylase [Mycobacterium botniense]GFG75092.1 DNA-deoxyinosine glycosylase [Mycobacterium botniense]